jgi:hypothetical protein
MISDAAAQQKTESVGLHLRSKTLFIFKENNQSLISRIQHILKMVKLDSISKGGSNL